MTPRYKASVLASRTVVASSGGVGRSEEADRTFILQAAAFHDGYCEPYDADYCLRMTQVNPAATAALVRTFEWKR
jgi:hypothetical protein